MAAARRLGSRGAIALAILVLGIVLAAILILQNLGDVPPRNSPPVRPGGDMRFTLPPSDDGTPLLRTDYAQDDRWRALLAVIATPNPQGFLANVSIATDPVLDGLTEEQIRALPVANNGPTFVLVADAIAQGDDEFPILVVDTVGQGRPSFRVAGRCLWAVENNLSLANMDWEEFADSTDADGVFRDC